MFRTGAQMCLLVLLAGLWLIQESRWPAVAAWEEGALDALARAEHGRQQAWRQRGGQDAAPAAPVTLVAIDDATVTDHPWPWSPLDFSLFLQATLPLQPEVTVVQEILNWQRQALPGAERQKLPQYERILRDALLRTPKVLLGQRLGSPEDPEALPPLEESPLLRHVQGNLHDIPEWTAISEQAAEEFRLPAQVGYTNFPFEPSALNRVPLVLRYRGEVVPSLALQAVLLWQRLSLDEVHVVLGSHLALGSKLRIPIDARGRVRVNFAAPYTTIAFDDLLLSSEQVAARQPPKAPVERLRGSITLLARTDAAARTHPLPWQRQIAPGEMAAAAIATIQGASFIALTPEWLPYGMVAAAALVAFQVPRWPRRAVAWWCAGIAAGYAFWAWLALALWRLESPLLVPFGLLLFTGLYRAATPNSVWRLRRPAIL